VNPQRPAATPSVPIEDFLQSLGSQLDRAQDSLALKVRAGRRLTWALKDISLDLQVFVEHDPRGRVTWRHAGPNEQGASRINLTFTTITKPMVEENTSELEEDPRGIDDIRLQAKLSEADTRQLEWMGIRTVGQFRRLSQDTDARAVQAVSGIPVDRLTALLQASAQPMVSRSEITADHDGTPLVRLYGANLSDGSHPEVRLNGEAMEVVESRPHRLVVRPMAHHRDGPVEVLCAAGRASGFMRLPTPTLSAEAPATPAVPAAVPTAVPAAVPAAVLPARVSP
jgi:hypothetical protein